MLNDRDSADLISLFGQIRGSAFDLLDSNKSVNELECISLLFEFLYSYGFSRASPGILFISF